MGVMVEVWEYNLMSETEWSRRLSFNGVNVKKDFGVMCRISQVRTVPWHEEDP